MAGPDCRDEARSRTSVQRSPAGSGGGGFGVEGAMFGIAAIELVIIGAATLIAVAPRFWS
jgi:hypothetical protein